MNVTNEVQKIMNQIDVTMDPRRMSQEQAKEYLEAIATDVEARLDGIKDDLKSKE